MSHRHIWNRVIRVILAPLSLKYHPRKVHYFNLILGQYFTLIFGIMKYESMI